jgi:hypothetical protein
MCILPMVYNQHSVGRMVFNATFNNISVISWRSVLVVEETGKHHKPICRNRDRMVVGFLTTYAMSAYHH